MKRNFFSSTVKNALVESGDVISFLQFSLLFGFSSQLLVEFMGGDALQRFSQRHERDLIRISRIVNQIAFDRIPVVCADRRQRAFFTNAFVEFILPNKTHTSIIDQRRRRRNSPATSRISSDVRRFPSPD